MTTSLDLLDLVHAAIVAADTDAGQRVYRPGDWPSQVGTMPQIKLRLLAEDRISIARSGPPEFTSTATVRIIAQVQAPATPDDFGASEAEAALWAIKRQVEVAVINSYPLTSVIQQIASVRSHLAFNADGALHLGAIQIDLALEFYEGPESFAPVDAEDVTELAIEATNYPPAATQVPLT